MRIYPPALEIGDQEGFDQEKDLFGRAGLASGMTHLMQSVENPLVVALDGPWGSGKTTFLKMWAGELRKAGFPVVFFDAFENDYVEDAFAAIARELVELIDESTSKQELDGKAFYEKASEMGVLLLKGGAKIGAKMAVRAATAGFASSNDLQDVVSDLETEAEAVADFYMKQILEEPKKQKATIEGFKQSLEKLPSLLSEKPDKPLVFIIDELDRCKPHFALEIIERIKHFFSVNNVHFVLGVHMDQLINSVKYAYGSEIDGNLYLQKFINLTVNLIIKNQDNDRSDLKRYGEYLAKSLGLYYREDGYVRSSAETIIRIVNLEQGGFRTVERAFTILAVAMAMTPEKHLKVGVIIGGLIMMKLLKPRLFVKAKAGTLNLNEVKDFLRFEPDKYRQDQPGFEESWWTYLLQEGELPEYLHDFGSSLWQYNIHDRRDVVRIMANTVVDRLSPNVQR